MRLSIPSTVILAAGLAEQAAGLRAVPSSPCASLCGDVTSTSKSDIICTADDLNTPSGQLFSNCISCELNSTVVDPVTGDTDLKWVLYNLRYAMSSCMWGFPGNTSVESSPCTTSRACEPFEPNFEFKALSPNITTYDYCANMPASDAATRCSGCIRQGDQTYLSNYFTTILAGCADQSGSPIALDGSLFGTDYVNVTFETTDPSAPSSNPTSVMSLGTRIGIAIGGICVLIALIGITIVCCGKHRRRARLAARQRRSVEYNGFGSGRVLPAPRVTTKWDSDMKGLQEESPMTANTYLNESKGFSPYSSKYSSPVSARDALAPGQWEWPLPSANSVKHLARSNEGFVMEKIRGGGSTVVTPVDKEQADQMLHQEWAMEAASRGFTVAPTLSLPYPPRAKQ